MNYSRWSDKDLRRVLDADERDVDAILEAAERFRKQCNEEEREHEFVMYLECPQCGHDFEEDVDILDYLPEVLS